MNPQERAYVAGIIDGEGWMGLVSDGKGRNPRVEVQVESTDKELTLWLKERAGGYCPASRQPRSERHKPIHRWRIGGPKARALLTEILPYLVIERRREKVIELLKGTHRGPKN